VSVTWLGHSSTVVDIDGVRFLTDPVLRRRVAHLRRAEPVPAAAVGRIDVVLVSHAHLDHLDGPSLRRLDRSAPIVLPRGAGGVAKRCGYRDVREVEAGDELGFGPVRVDVAPAEHGTIRRFVRASSEAVGFVLRGSKSVYFAGDTDLFDGMRELAPVDVALLPVAGWGPRIPAGHLDPRRAAEALRLVRPQVVVPVHWGTFRTPFAPPPDDGEAREFARAAAELAPEVDVRILRPGETLSL
jgi:L-ascorbate metabolism protein UlaG (beta-lactamase superfamily)